jgi:plastocyanin
VCFAATPVLGANTNVEIIDFAFSPASVSIQVNDSVVWTWVGPTVHTATSNAGLWDSGLLSTPGAKFTHTFGSSGSFPYFCEVHPFMTASVTVQTQTPPNVPPTVSITSPASGATFPAPWTGSIQASVGDSDGTVTQIVFLAGSTVLGSIPDPPANPSFNVTNLAAGTYVLTAVASDNAGASTTSLPVNIIVTGQTNQPPGITNITILLVSPISFEPQTGLFNQSVGVTNGTGSAVTAVRLSVLGLPADVVLYDASGSTNGAPFVEYRQPLDAGASVAFLLEYYRSNRLEFVSTNFVATAVPLTVPAAPTGTVLQLDRAPFLSNGALVIEFASVPGKSYVVEYSANMQTWSPAVPPVIAAGTRVQWTDAGPPKTESAPVGAGQRFYRVVQLP